MAEPIEVPGWPKPRGYSDAMRADGTVVTLAGMVGWDPLTHQFASDDFAAQAAQALRNVAAALAAAGCRPADVVRMTWYITDRAAYLAATGAVGAAYRECFGKHYPPMTLVIVAGLLEPRARVEIEVTCVQRHAGD